MKLRGLSLYQVGPHQGRVLGDVPDGLVVVVGPNEAGKSSLMAGLRGVLFRKVMMGERDIKAEAGARGLAWLEAADGQTYQVERILSRRTPPKITLEQDQWQGDDALIRLFPGLEMVEESVYQSVFTFQLSELRDFTDSADKLSSRIYTVGMVGTQSPIEVESVFEQAAKDIFNRRSRTAPLVQLNQEIDLLEQRREALQDTPQAYVVTQSRLAQQIATEQEAVRKVEDAKRHAAELGKQWEVLPIHREWIAAQAIFAGEAATPVIPRTVIQETEVWTTRREENHNVLTDKQRQCEAMRMACEDGVVTSTLAQSVESLRALQVAVSERIVEAEGVADWEASRVAAEQQQQDLVRALHPLLWTPDRLTGIPIHAGTQDALRNWEGRIQSGRQQLQQAQSELDRAKAEVARHEHGVRAKLTESGHQGEALDEVVSTRSLRVSEQERMLRADEERMAQFEVDYQRWQQSKSQLAAWSTQSGRSSAKPTRQSSSIIGLGLLVAVFGLAIAVFGHGILRWLGALLTLTDVALTTLAQRSVRQRSARSAEDSADTQMEQLRTTVTQAQEDCEVLLAHLESQPNVRFSEITVEIVRAMKQALRSGQADLQTERLALPELRALSRAGQALHTALELAQAQLVKVQEVLRQEEAAWQNYVSDWGFSVGVGEPSDLLRDLEPVKAWRRHEVERVALTTKIEQRKQMLGAFCEQSHHFVDELFPGSVVRESAVALDFASALATPSSLSSLAAKVEMALQRAEAQRAREKEQQSMLEAMAQITSEIEVVDVRLQEIDGQLDGVWKAYGVDSALAFSELVARSEEKQEQEATLRQLESRVIGHCGSLTQYEAMVERLNALTPEILQELQVHAQSVVLQAEEQLQQVRRDVWHLEQQLQRWEAEKNTSDLTWQLAVAKAEREQLAQRWGKWTLAQWLTREARLRFERTRKPASLQASGHMMERITGGKYVQLTARLNDKSVPELYVNDRDGRDWSVQQLSRGTREQVYFALRLALLQDYRQRNVYLPVIFDDVMVNFDEERRRQFFQILGEESASQQMIYLTCHEAHARVAAEVAGAHVIRLT